MKVYNGSTTSGSIGSSATCIWIKGTLDVTSAITITACKIDGIVDTRGSNGRVTINYCNINPSSPQDWSVGDHNFSITRSQITGSSDGVRYAGSTNDVLIENYIRTKDQSSDDHHDGVQMYGAEGGGTLLRNNIDVHPVGGSAGITAPIFVADGATGTYEIRDNYLIGVLRLHENGYYRVTGNIIQLLSGDGNSPINTSNSRSGAFLEWTNNATSSGTAIPKP
jgi:hypothetical protein